MGPGSLALGKPPVAVHWTTVSAPVVVQPSGATTVVSLAAPRFDSPLPLASRLSPIVATVAVGVDVKVLVAVAVAVAVRVAVDVKVEVAVPVAVRVGDA